MSRIKIFTGHFGSGKTEVAINFAINSANENKNTAIVDLDIVNPYFCTRSLKDKLNKKGVKVISSDPDLLNAELMVVPAEVLSVFNDKSYQAFFDVGGDDQGAVALGQFNRFFKSEPYDMYYVINNKRPFTSNIEDTEKYIKFIEAASRLKVTHLISNNNLSYETTVSDILKGDKLVEELSRKLRIPHAYTVCRKDLADKVQGKVSAKVFSIDIYMKTPWE
ncbi:MULTISPECIES: ParA family protein [Clostridium]|uniref:ATP-binding protein n=1 Tax=Clostridium lapidicellarium TaxID=3240931 RepID=A0ABV4E005_9CLOT